MAKRTTTTWSFAFAAKSSNGRRNGRRELYGASHVFSKDEAKFLFEDGCEQIIIGSGQMGNVHLSAEAEAYFKKHGCKVRLEPTGEAIGVFNRSREKRLGSFT
jgi:hypothetical protein